MRAFVSGTITFGLVTIPVKFYVSASDQGLSFNNITKAGNRVKIRYVDEVTGEEAPYDSCVKGYEFAKGQFVTFTADELKALELQTSKTIDIREFVPESAIGYLNVEKTYYLGPDKGGDKGYALLSDAMRAKGAVAIAQWVNKGKEHLVAVRPHGTGLALQVLWYKDEIRDFNQIEVTAFPITDPERELAGKLISMLMNDAFELDKYQDRHAKLLLAAVQAKSAGREIVIPENAPAATALDLISALKQSVVEKTPKAKKKGKRNDP